MPRNRRPQDREEKRAEIVAAATTLFTESGYDETPVSRVAVLDHVLGSALAEAAREPDRQWVDQVLWAVDRLDQYRRLVTVVHARTATSPTIDTWHNGFHAL